MDFETDDAVGGGEGANKRDPFAAAYYWGEGGEGWQPPVLKEEVPVILNEVPMWRFQRYALNISGYRFTPTFLDLTNMSLNDITNVKKLYFLYHLDVSKNRLTLESLSVVAAMEFLFTLAADHNRIQSAEIPTMENLLSLSLKNNKIVEAETNLQPHLSKLCLDGNSIRKSKLESINLPSLELLSLSGNRFESMRSITIESLVCLYLAHNNISRLSGMDRLVNLKRLHLRGNRIKILNSHWFPRKLTLSYVNFRDNQIETTKELKRMKNLTSLVTIVTTGNPLEEEDDFRIEILARLPTLCKVNKDNVTRGEHRRSRRKRKGYLRSEMKEELEEDEPLDIYSDDESNFLEE